MTEEQLQKFYAMAEPRSENAIRKAEERKSAVRCRNCKFFKPRIDVCNFYYCAVRTWGKYDRHYSVKPHTKGCDKFERNEI